MHHAFLVVEPDAHARVVGALDHLDVSGFEADFRFLLSESFELFGSLSLLGRPADFRARLLAIVLFLMSRLVRVLDPDARRVLVGTAIIIFIYREEVYEKDSPRKGIADIIIGKQRNGPVGEFHLTFLGEYTRFENFASPEFVGDYR